MRRRAWNVPRMLPLLLSLLLLLSVAGSAVARPYTPERGSADRKGIFDALRVPVQRALGVRVLFVVKRLKVEDGWAFFRGHLVDPDGNRIHRRHTRLRGEHMVEPGLETMAILQKVNEQWLVRDYAIGPTDVAWVGFIEKFPAPRGIFPP